MSPPLVREETKAITTELMELLAPPMVHGALWEVLRAATPDEIDVAFRWTGQALSDIVHRQGPHHG